MTTRLLAKDLLVHLKRIEADLRAVGREGGARAIEGVIAFASGSTSEFYGEARVVLPGVLRAHASSLPAETRTLMLRVIEGVEHELRLIGGA